MKFSGALYTHRTFGADGPGWSSRLPVWFGFPRLVGQSPAARAGRTSASPNKPTKISVAGADTNATAKTRSARSRAKKRSARVGIERTHEAFRLVILRYSEGSFLHRASGRDPSEYLRMTSARPLNDLKHPPVSMPLQPAL